MVIICIVNSFMEKELPISGTAPSGVPSITGEPTKQWINSPHGFPPTDPGSTTFHQWSVREMVAAGKNLRTPPHRKEEGTGRLLLFAAPGVHHGGAELSITSAAGRNRFERVGGAGSLFCRGQDANLPGNPGRVRGG